MALVLLVVACKAKDDGLTELKVMTQNGPVTYRVEVALTREDMAQGLMNRQELAPDSGMLFNVGGQQGISMWMKDTYIPLDMIFINQEGTIIAVAENTEPLSTELITPQTDEPIFAVIEVNGGDLKKNGIAVGDIVSYHL
jgi:hypothetical protein